MPVFVNETLNNSIEWFTSFPIINSITENPFLLSITISIIIVILILFFFRNVSSETEATWKIALKVGIYSLVATTIMVFIHNKKIELNHTRIHKSGAMDEIFRNVDNENLGITDSIVNVSPNFAL